MDNYDGLTVGDVLTEEEIQKKNPRIYENSLMWDSATGEIIQASSGGGGGGGTVDLTTLTSLLEQITISVSSVQETHFRELNNIVSVDFEQYKVFPSNIITAIEATSLIDGSNVSDLGTSSTIQLNTGETFKSGNEIVPNSFSNLRFTGSFRFVWKERAVF